MAKYIKFDLTASNPSPELLILADSVTYAARVNDTTTDVFLSINNAATTKWRITHSSITSTTAVVSAIQDALKANPGGIVSTVVGPLSTAQVPAAGGGGADGKGQNGRTVITTPAEYVTFTSAAFTA